MKFVVCEGLDKAGKTSVLKKIVDSSEDYVYVKGVTSTSFVGRLARKYPSTLTLLVDLAYTTFTRIIPELLKGKTVFQDRYVYSLQAYVPSSERFYNRLLFKLFSPLLLEPDTLVYFTVAREERIRRIEKDSDNIHHKRLIENPELIDLRDKKFHEIYSNFPEKKMMLNTTVKSIEESVDEFYEILEDNIEV